MSKKPPAAKRNRSGSEKRQRDCIVKFRAKLAERAAIKASAAAAGLSVGSFLRSLALAAPRTRTVHLPRPDEASVNQFLGQVGRYTRQSSPAFEARKYQPDRCAGSQLTRRHCTGGPCFSRYGPRDLGRCVICDYQQRRFPLRC